MQLSYFVLVICSFAIPLLFFSFYRWHNTRKNKQAPFTEKFLRSPGQSLNEQIQSVSEYITIYAGYVMTVPLFILSTVVIFNLNLIYFFVMIVIFESFYFRQLWKALTRRRLLRLGYDGEVAVGQELNLLMLDGYHVFHDFLVKDRIIKFNIDHIIVGSTGVYAVETKARSKSSVKKRTHKATVFYDGNGLKFPNYFDTDSLIQARLRADHLEEWLTSAIGEEISVKAVLTIPGWYVERKSSPRGVHVLNPKQIKAFLNSQKEKTLSDTMIRRIVHQLDQKCRDIHPITVQMQAEAG